MPSIVLIISGSIAAYKSLELIRLLRAENITVRVILTPGGAEFITPLSCAALSGEPVSTDLFSLTEETEMGHIRLAREADLVVVAPATANLLARTAQGLADDLASSVLLTTTAPLLMVPAMNVEMWNNVATQTNVSLLKERGIEFIGPAEGELACGEIGLGKMVEPSQICEMIVERLRGTKPLKGKRAVVTAGPTQEPLDPVRYFTNGSSGKQGYAIAEALLRQGADVTLITGPTSLPLPKGAKVVQVQTAEEMKDATEKALPADIAICTAAVADWRPQVMSPQKMKKTQEEGVISVKPTPDILGGLAVHPQRPKLLIGFAAETENLVENATKKLSKCDWVIANDVSQGIIGHDETQVHWITTKTREDWAWRSKKDVAARLVTEIEKVFV